MRKAFAESPFGSLSSGSKDLNMPRYFASAVISGVIAKTRISDETIVTGVNRFFRGDDVVFIQTKEERENIML